MKVWKRILASAVTAAMTFTLFTGSVFATENQDNTSNSSKMSYSYRVTFYAGNQGNFNDDTKDYIEVTRGSSTVEIIPTVESNQVVLLGLQYGDKVSFVSQKQDKKPAAVTLGSDSKYYVKGVRESGRDNSEAAATIFEVTGDKDYVVAYGIKGQQVKYTVNYHDKNGKELAPSDIFYGNVGDKPVVAYKYIAGYAPQAFGLTKTLVADESENVFTFVYDAVSGSITRVETEVVETTETVEQIVNNTVVIGGGTGGASNVTGGGTGAGGAAGEGEGAGAEGAGAEGTAGEEEGGLIVDLDEETPLANIDVDGSEVSKALPMAAYVGMGLLAILAIIAAVYLTQKLKKKEEA